MDRRSDQEHEEREIGRLLRAAGPRQQLPDKLRQQWEEQFRRELAPVLARRRQVRRRALLGLCGGLAVVAMGLLFNLNQPAAPVPSVRVTHVSGDHLLRSARAQTGSLQAGQRLTGGSRVSTGDDGHVALSYNGYDLRLNSLTLVELEAQRLRLHSGEVYVSSRQRQRPAHKLLIETPQGTVRDIGTQFMVTLQPDQTVTTVRRGTVVVNPGNGDVRVAAPVGSAIRISVDGRQHVQQRRVAPAGDNWRWIYRGRPGLDLEGSSVHEFLQWSVAESGLRLEFATEAAEIYARSTLLHGDLGDLDPEQAVYPVLATTDLQVQLSPGNILLVSLGFRG